VHAERARLDTRVLNLGFTGTYQLTTCSGLMRQLVISHRSHAHQIQVFPELGDAKSQRLVEVARLSEDSGCVVG